MLRLVVRILLTAVLFCYVFPHVASGVQFHGKFWPDGIIYAAVFSIVAYIVGMLIGLVVTVFALATRGFGLLVVIPVLMLGFWFIPAIQLQVFSHFFPEQFTVAGWGSAIWAGLFLLVVNLITASRSRKTR